MTKKWSKRHAVIERLREGPMTAEEAYALAASPNSFRVILHNLRSAGYVIDREVVYTLKANPTEERK